MKAYLVFMRDSTIQPAPGRNPRRTAIVKCFDDLADAQSFTQTKISTRDFATVYKKIEGGDELEKIEEYRMGKKQQLS